MGSIDRRLESLEAGRKRRGARLTREALAQLSDEELDALEEELLAEARAGGEQPPPNEFLQKMNRWEAETIEEQHRHAEESRRRARKGAPR